jgi:hypothetical protein
MAFPSNPSIGQLYTEGGVQYFWDGVAWVLKGHAGPAGIQGIQGIQGILGTGIQGITGIQGFPGPQGIIGVQGIQGTQGIQGLQGFTGAGTQGIQGTSGVQGTSGANILGANNNFSAANEFSGSLLISAGSGGGEGGEFSLKRPPTTSLAGDVIIDINGNSLRIFEAGGTFRGVAVNLTAQESQSTIWTSGNDGAGSGLDADLLDGLQGSAYAQLSGATFTGTLNIDAAPGWNPGIFNVRSGTLGGTATNTSTISTMRVMSGNEDKIIFDAVRNTTGVNWDTASLRIRRMVDASNHNFLEFANNGTFIGWGANRRVGIYDTSANAMDVVGKLNVTSAMGVSRGIIDFNYTQSGLTIWNTDNSPLFLGTSGVNRMQISATGIITLGTQAPQSTSIAGMRVNGNNFEWGHTNTAGYQATLGAEANTGAPFIALNAEAGTTSNTYRTRGVLGAGIRSNNSGGLTFFTLTNANADNQSPTNIMHVMGTGVVGIGVATPANILHLGAGSVGTQQTLTAYGWSDSVVRQRWVIETDAAFSLYTYNDAGTFIGRALTIPNSGRSIIADVDMRAPVFYDSNDTAFYLNPNDFSLLNRVSSYTAARDTNANWNTGFQNTPVSSYAFHGDLNGGTNAAGTGWWFYESMRHGNSSNFWGTQIAWGWEDNGNRLLQRNVSANSFSAWVEYLSTAGRTYTGGLLLTGTIQANGDMRAPIYYDSANTGYYVDPNGTSELWKVNVSHGQNVGSLLNASGGLGGLEVRSNSSSDAAFINFHRPAAYGAYFGIDTDNQFAIGGWSAGAALAAMKVGQLGVGTAASGTTGEIRATNNITAYYSDMRLKDIKGKITNAIEKVTQLNGYYYVENELAEQYGYENKKEQVGVGAQEVERVLPHVVTPAPFDIAKNEEGVEYSKSGENYLTVRYERLIPLLIEAIKEQQLQIEQLQMLERHN